MSEGSRGSDENASTTPLPYSAPGPGSGGDVGSAFGVEEVRKRWARVVDDAAAGARIVIHAPHGVRAVLTAPTPEVIAA
ncbi:hypothetical protein [Embleya hyalina]|uniref:Uncharacterized protein n=1 Tax=Embleya hyalina TaxID=516124 RepID=A0A401YWX9_9ACTN|nr:hypothetical protein [Embleya hyalina]GCD99081.1 hypothetical protein EHYA_06793 [Embleya hyalina]